MSGASGTEGKLKALTEKRRAARSPSAVSFETVLSSTWSGASNKSRTDDEHQPFCFGTRQTVTLRSSDDRTGVEHGHDEDAVENETDGQELPCIVRGRRHDQWYVYGWTLYFSLRQLDDF